MQRLREIRRHMKVIREIRHITKAMKLVSAAKLKQAQERVEASRPFARRISEVLIDISALTSGRLHPLMKIKSPDRSGIVVITSDRGLCGRFNHDIIETTLQQIEALGGKEKVGLITVGKVGRDFFRRQGFVIEAEHVRLFRRPTFGWAQEISAEVMDLYDRKVFDHVYLIYSRFYSAMVQRPKVFRLIPIAPIKEEGEQQIQRGTCILVPSAEEILGHLVARYIETEVFRALLENDASERGARMTAMSSATDNATEMIDQLTLEYHRSRQAVITREIAEIIGGAEALNGVV